MAHIHADEYQIKVVHQDGTEELSGWMDSVGQVAQAVAAIHCPSGATCWLRARTVLCPYCLDMEQTIVECPLTGIPSPRSSPRDSYYLLKVGLKSRQAVFSRHFRQ